MRMTRGIALGNGIATDQLVYGRVHMSAAAEARTKHQAVVAADAHAKPNWTVVAAVLTAMPN